MDEDSMAAAQVEAESSRRDESGGVHLLPQLVEHQQS